MIKLKEAIIVEGKYDKIKLSSIVDGLVIETNGFRIFKDTKKLNLIRKLAEENGVIILTDSDSAGFMIRNYLSSSITKGTLYHAYIPDCFGKEKRKSNSSKEGKIGVEGLDNNIIENAIKNSGLHIKTVNEPFNISKIRLKFYERGFLGGKLSKQKRNNLKKQLGLPEYLTTNVLIKVLFNRFNLQEIDKILLEACDK